MFKLRVKHLCDTMCRKLQVKLSKAFSEGTLRNCYQHLGLGLLQTTFTSSQLTDNEDFMNNKEERWMSCCCQAVLPWVPWLQQGCTQNCLCLCSTALPLTDLDPSPESSSVLQEWLPQDLFQIPILRVSQPLF